MAYLQGRTLSCARERETTTEGWREPNICFCSPKHEPVSSHQPLGAAANSVCTVGVSVLPCSPLLPAASLTSALLLPLLALPLPPPLWQGAPCRLVSPMRASWTCR